MLMKQLLEGGILAQVSRFVEAETGNTNEQLDRLIKRCLNYYYFNNNKCEQFNDELLDQLSDGQDKIQLEGE